MHFPALLLALQLSASPGLWDRCQQHEAGHLVPLLQSLIRFPTVAGNTSAREAQQAWLKKMAEGFGLNVRVEGLITEIDLPGPPGAPVLGLVVHGDVVTVDAKAWTVPPFEGVVKDGKVWGRGAADDKGPLAQALLALKVLKESGLKRSHTVRLLVGGDEESGSTDLAEYLAHHAPPDYSLVLDSEFPVVVGEKAWSALTVTEPASQPGLP